MFAQNLLVYNSVASTLSYYYSNVQYMLHLQGGFNLNISGKGLNQD